MRSSVIAFIGCALIAVPAFSNSPSRHAERHIWVMRSQIGPRQPFLGPIALTVPLSGTVTSEAAAPELGHYEWVEGQTGPRATPFGTHRAWVEDHR